jgi:hypothetical protein
MRASAQRWIGPSPPYIESKQTTSLGFTPLSSSALSPAPPPECAMSVSRPRVSDEPPASRSTLVANHVRPALTNASNSCKVFSCSNSHRTPPAWLPRGTSTSVG